MTHKCSCQLIPRIR